MDADVVVLASEACFEELAAEARAQAGLDVELFGNQNPLGLGELGHDFFVVDVERGLADDAGVDALALQLFARGDSAVEAGTKRHDVAFAVAFANEVVLARFKLVVVAVEPGPVFLEDVRDLRSVGEDEA